MDRLISKTYYTRGAGLYSGICTLGDARICDANGTRQCCAGCGWHIAEVKRRKRLPLHRNHHGLWQKRVGIRKSEPEEE